MANAIKILIVDDDKNYAERLKRPLKNAGYNVLVYTKTSPNEEMTASEINGQCYVFRPNVVFCDCQLNPEIRDCPTDDGWTFAEQSGGRDFRLIMMSGVREEFAADTLRPQAQACGAEFVRKEDLLQDVLSLFPETKSV